MPLHGHHLCNWTTNDSGSLFGSPEVQMHGAEWLCDFLPDSPCAWSKSLSRSAWYDCNTVVVYTEPPAWPATVYGLPFNCELVLNARQGRSEEVMAWQDLLVNSATSDFLCLAPPNQIKSSRGVGPSQNSSWSWQAERAHYKPYPRPHKPHPPHLGWMMPAKFDICLWTAEVVDLLITSASTLSAPNSSVLRKNKASYQSISVSLTNASWPHPASSESNVLHP